VDDAEKLYEAGDNRAGFNRLSEVKLLLRSVRTQ